MRILVVEDDAGIANGLRSNLQQRGYAVDVCATLDSAWAALRSEVFDLVLLDLGLPDGDGGHLLQRIRQSKTAKDGLPDALTPVLIMTARDQVADRISGLNLGADDYLAKPFDLDELEARLRALIRRERRQVGSEVLKVADLVLDPASLRATRGGSELQLSPIGLRLLTILMRESPRVVSRQEIEREIWGNGLPDSDTLRSHLYNLRKVIDKPFDNALLHTVQSAGYRIADISGQIG